MSIGLNNACWVLLVFVYILLPAADSILKIKDLKTEDHLITEIEESIRSRRALPPPTKSPNGEICYGYNGQKGRCLELENCVLKPLKENYIKYKAYYCITSQRTVGVCCPNTIAIPDVYNEATFHSQGITARRRSERSEPSTSSQRFRRNVAAEAKTCGRNGRLLSQVAKNGLVENKAWPWVVTIINADSKEHHCGATLISRYHILSAAHCFYYGGGYVLKERVKARLGEYDFKKQDDSSFNDYNISNIILHERYDEPTHENDIALLILERPARYTIYVQPACMPTPGEMYEGKTAVVVGWGLMEFAGPSSSVLREVQVPVWNHDVCSKNYLQTIFDTNVCAAGFEGGKDSCQGDSGGPLMVQRDDGRWEVMGIVSWGVQCGLKGKPGIYTQINKYNDWLNDKMA